MNSAGPGSWPRFGSKATGRRAANARLAVKNSNNALRIGLVRRSSTIHILAGRGWFRKMSHFRREAGARARADPLARQFQFGLDRFGLNAPYLP